MSLARTIAEEKLPDKKASDIESTVSRLETFCHASNFRDHNAYIYENTCSRLELRTNFVYAADWRNTKKTVVAKTRTIVNNDLLRFFCPGRTTAELIRWDTLENERFHDCSTRATCVRPRNELKQRFFVRSAFPTPPDPQPISPRISTRLIAIIHLCRYVGHPLAVRDVWVGTLHAAFPFGRCHRGRRPNDFWDDANST